MNNAELQAFIQDEMKKAQARTFPMADFVRLQSIHGMPRPVVLDAQGNEVSREYDHEWSSEYMGTFDNAPLMPTLTLGALKSAEKAMSNAPREPPPAAPFGPSDLFLSWSAPAATPLRKGQLVTLLDDGTVAGIEVQPGDKLTFIATQEPWLPWPAPYSFPVEVTITPEPYRSLDADARTRTAEWQEDVRKRFERRVGAALTSTTQRT